MGNEPPCDACIPELFYGSQSLVDVYWVCRDQYSVDINGHILHLSITAVKAAMDIHEIPVDKQRNMLDSVIYLFWHFEPLNRKGAY